MTEEGFEKWLGEEAHILYDRECRYDVEAVHVDSVRALFARLKAEREWVAVAERLPEQGHAVLTYHEGDIYPQVAFYVLGTVGGEAGRVLWMCERDGPEDGEHQDFRSLFHDPTHWRELPPPPETKDVP